MKIIDLTGKKFNRLYVIEKTNMRYANGNTIWKCLCNCGNIKNVSGNHLKSGHTKSCGCLSIEVSRELGIKNNLPKGEAGFRQMKKLLIDRAVRKNRKMNISDEDLRYLTKQNCYYCGIAPCQRSRCKNDISIYMYNGLDRINNSEGYELINVIPCCGKCNSLRGDRLTVEETLKVIKLLKKLRKKDNIWEAIT